MRLLPGHKSLHLQPSRFDWLALAAAFAAVAGLLVAVWLWVEIC